MKAHREHLAQFAQTYGPLGWTTYDRVSTTLLAELSSLEPAAGEARLTSHHLDPDALRILSHRMRIPAYEPWAEVLERAVERAAAEDYLSAVPLLLLIIDGVCTTTTQKHPFSGGADAPVFDTLTSGPGGIADGLKILGATRRKLSTEPLSAPYRHGIVHGLEPNFGRAIVAAKAFNLLQAMVDYFDRRRDEAARMAKAAEEQRQPSWKEVAGGIRDLEVKKRALAAWKARDPVSEAVLARKGEPHTLDPQSPSTAAAKAAAGCSTSATCTPSPAASRASPTSPSTFCAPTSVWALIRSPRLTTSWLARPTCAVSTIATACPARSPPTTPGLGASTPI